VKTRILRRAGYEVLEAASGAEALELVASRHPDLMLLDVKLPDANGRDICARVKGDPKSADVAVLQTSALHVDMRDRVASLDAGADGYLVEPMEPEELLANVRALLRLKRAEQERARALEALQDADRRKDDFLAMLAHELRNPLAPIRNAVEILRLSQDHDVRDRARDLVGRQVEHLARLVDDLLEVSRITRGKVVLQTRPVPLVTIVRSALDVARPLLDAQRHELAATEVPGDVWIDVDAVRMSQVLGNLLHNAAKFTPAGGRITVSARVRDDAIEIAVEDNGVGISADVLPHIFDLFAQADRSLDRSQGGLGIGLSLVKGLVEMHGGSVAATSAGAGAGSRFTLLLPRSLVVDAPAQGGAPATPVAALGARRVLLVEDNADAAEAMLLLLRELGHEVRVVYDGLEALDAAQSFDPDVMLLDIGLPGMDGYELARRMRAMPRHAEALIVAVSGYGQEKDRQRSAAAGFDAHLVKPVDPRAFVAVIGGASSGKGSARPVDAS
jgi:signal transduction histidine kinase/BarA-like signal transduction histidine kinase